MDAKSLAKSKRAHSQHHSKKHHPIQKGKATTSSAGASSTEKAPGKAVKDKPRQSKGPGALPSNWDRYEDEDDSATENPSDSRLSQPSDIVLPKSKGADYAYLISEAKSQYSSGSNSEIFPCFDDFLTDFDKGKGFFISVHGESIVTSIQNDSFFVEEKATASHEASFFSLDLHAISEQLAKVDLPKRLFMEADLLPPELCVGVQEIHVSGQNQDLNESEVDISSDQEKYADNYGEMASKDTSNSNNNGGQTSNKHSKFEAETAEAELDMLLDSLNDTKINDSVSFHDNSSQFVSTFSVKKSKGAINIDDTLDDLLNETSNLELVDQKGTSPSHEVNPTKSKLLDDFDSWLDTI